jgi:nucleotide-binding universal stress UspA family protein
MNGEQDYRPEDRQTARYQRILVATDGSECSVRAAAHAVYLAEALGTRLYALYSVNVHRAFHMGIHYGEAVAELKRFGRSAIDAVGEMAQERGLEVDNPARSGRAIFFDLHLRRPGGRRAGRISVDGRVFGPSAPP